MTEYGPSYRTLSKIAGHSIFVSKRNAGFPHAYRFAELLGTSLLTLGRNPTLHHAEAVTEDERDASNPQNQDVMCPAIVAAVQRFGALP